MSKTPLQLYINERYNDTISGYVNKEWYYQHKKSRKHRSDTFNGRQPTFKQLLHSYTNSDLCFGSQTIFKNYLREHKKSIEDYYNLQKQQKEILRLCKEKIAKKFPAQLTANLADEDVIRALKIAQNSESSQAERSCSSDQVVDAILKFITSNNEQQKLRKKKNSSAENYVPVKTKSYETNVLPQNTKRNSAFKRFFGVFKKSKIQPSVKQQCNFVVQPKKEHNSSWSCPQIKEQDISSSDSAIESDTSVTPNESKTKVFPIINLPSKAKHKHYVSKPAKIIVTHQTETVGTKCVCHSKVKKLTHDIKRQETQIKEIQSTLRHCLKILKQIEQPRAKLAPELIKKSKISEKSETFDSDLNIPGKIQYHYRVENVPNKPTAPERKKVQKKHDKNAGEVKRVCCYKCKKKRKTTDKTVSASPDKLTAGTSTSQNVVQKARSESTTIQPPTQPTTITTTTTQPTAITTTTQILTGPNAEVDKEAIDGTSIVSSSLGEEHEDDIEHRPLTKKEKKRLKKKTKKELKQEKKKQKQIPKERQKKRCCLIRLIKFICCSGCCT